MDLKDTLIVLETRGWEALTRPGAAATYYEDVLADDAVMVFPSGVMPRDEALAAMRSAAPWSRYKIEMPRVFELTADCATLLYKVTARRTGEPTFVAMINSSYVLRGGRWRLVLHQQSPKA